MVHGREALFLFVVLKHGEVHDPEEIPRARLEQFELARDIQPQFTRGVVQHSEGAAAGRRFESQQQNQIAGLSVHGGSERRHSRFAQRLYQGRLRFRAALTLM